jgi:glycosyltransferase involved in cell wall biosynthesis
VSTPDLVSVVVPAYNAAATLDETLRSIRAQTYRNLEVIIVDDGSKDATVAIARRHAARDSRLRVVTQSNGGVAAARNRGIAEAHGDLVAPVDADDLWSPDKIEKQLRALKAGGGNVALVYTWYALIDDQSRITDTTYRPTEEGDVLRRMCCGNLVGNGSSPLMLKSAVRAAGGYDSTLRARKAQGCEDVLLYYRIAERHRFALVAEPLTGYRQTPTNMSSDSLQMLRSWDLVAREMTERYPQFRDEVRRGTVYMAAWLLALALRRGRGHASIKLAIRLLCLSPRALIATLGDLAMRRPAAALPRQLRRLARALAGRAPRPMPRFAIGVTDGERL